MRNYFGYMTITLYNNFCNTITHLSVKTVITRILDYEFAIIHCIVQWRRLVMKISHHINHLIHTYVYKRIFYAYRRYSIKSIYLSFGCIFNYSNYRHIKHSELSSIFTTFTRQSTPSTLNKPSIYFLVTTSFISSTMIT